MGDVAAVGAYSRVSLQVTSAVPQNLVAKEDKRLMTWTQAHNDGGRCTVFKITIIKIRVVVGPTVT